MKLLFIIILPFKNFKGVIHKVYSVLIKFVPFTVITLCSSHIVAETISVLLRVIKSFLLKDLINEC